MKSVRAKIQFCMMVTLLLTLGIIATTTIVLNYKTTMSTLEQSMIETTAIASERVEKELEIYKQIAWEVGCIAQVADSGNSAENKKEIIDQRAAAHGFQRGNVLGLDGVSIFDGKDYSDRVYFQEAKKGTAYVSTPLISKITGELTIMVAAPIWKDGSPNTQVVGVVYFVPKETFLNDIIANVRVGENGGGYILDKNGAVIAHENIDLVKEGYNVQEDAEAQPELAGLEQKMTQGETGFGQCQYQGNDTLIAYAPIAGTDGWSLAVHASRSEMIASTVRSITITVIILIVSIVAAILIASWLAGGIARPITACVRRMEGLVAGDLSSPVPQSKAKDETGQLLHAVQGLVEGIGPLINDMDYLMDGMATGNFQLESCCPERYVGEFSGLLRSAQNLNRDLSETLLSINSSADYVSGSAAQMSTTSQALAQGASEQASSVDDLATAINDISQQVETAASQARTAMEENLQSHQQIETCNGYMRQLVKAMNDIDQRATEIGKVIKTIEDIAFQTNILALNASVEAARAGSAGKGFAVVAQEVRNLANKSAEASQSTSALIENTVTAVQEGTLLSSETEKALQEVVSSAENVLEAVKSIDASAQEQSLAVSKISSGIEQISNVVQTNAATAQQSAATSEELSSQAELLKKLVNRFQLQQAVS